MGVPSEERTGWLKADEHDPGYCEFSEAEIISIGREKNEETNEEEADDDKINPPTVSHASACQALQTVITYLEQQPTAPMGTMIMDFYWKPQKREYM